MMLNDFPPITDAGSMPVSPPPTDEIQVRPSLFNSGGFQLLTVQLEENNKLLKQLCKKKKKKNNHKKSFLQKVGDAFCKALPTILTTFTTAVIGVFFKMPSNKKALQTA